MQVELAASHPQPIAAAGTDQPPRRPALRPGVEQSAQARQVPSGEPRRRLGPLPGPERPDQAPERHHLVRLEQQDDKQAALPGARNRYDVAGVVPDFERP